MRCFPVAHFSVQYISHNRELIEENEIPLLILQKTENGNGFRKGKPCFEWNKYFF